MALSDRDRRILTAIEDELTQRDPALADLLNHPRPAVYERNRQIATRLGALVGVLLAVVLAYPLAAGWGAVGVGLLTVALVVPWVVVAARGDAGAPASPQRDRTAPRPEAST